ncbi:MAG: hypothetical protein H6550_16360, partial [Chitinophagales bacterium]|nr:hypothetical protein [Chitinophagales bacterium]
MNILGFSITRSKNIDADLAIFQKAMVEHMESGSLVKGRSSENTTVDFMSSLLNESQAMKPEFNIEVLRICNYLAKHNSDISYAVDNIVQLGNTPENITFDDGVSADQAKEMIKYLNVYEKSIYAGGMNSLKNDLFAQLAITGAVSLEAIPKRDMSGLDKVVLVDPYHIRFIYNDSTYSYDPYQKLPDKLGYKDDLHKLNTDQYKYYALRRMSDSPYAIPPFMAAFEGLELEKDMLKNMRNIIRKLGIFGFLSVMLTPPRRKQNETDAQFTARCTQYLENIRPEVEKGYAGGMAMGFEGQTKYNIEASTTNVSGASDVM